MTAFSSIIYLRIVSIIFVVAYQKLRVKRLKITICLCGNVLHARKIMNHRPTRFVATPRSRYINISNPWRRCQPTSYSIVSKSQEVAIVPGQQEKIKDVCKICDS